MKLWLTKEHNGTFMLTALLPMIEEIRGVGQRAVYMRPGDPVGVRHICPWFVEQFDIQPDEIQEFESVRVELTGGKLFDDE